MKHDGGPDELRPLAEHALARREVVLVLGVADYDVSLVVLGPKGDALATNSVKGQENIGNAGLSPGQTISGALGRKRELLFDNEKVITALK